MSTDSELMELAAKAAGIPVKWEATHGCFWIKFGYGLEIKIWSPLTDDGDALRLAVKLGLLVNVWSAASTTIVSTHEGGHIADAEEHHYDGDPYAATRRAIVRAAAEIGRNLG